MGLKETWIDKVNEEDVIDAEDINDIAHAVIDLEESGGGGGGGDGDGGDRIGAPGTGENAEIFNDYTNNTASGNYAHAEGSDSKAWADYSHAEGHFTEADGQGAHAEGIETVSSGGGAHAEGIGTIADGRSSHAEGESTIANGRASHAEGYGTKTERRSQHVEGEYNKVDEHLQGTTTRGKYIHIAGNGDSGNNRSNAHTLDWNGLGWFAGGLKIGGTDQDDPEAKAVALLDDVDDAVSEALEDAKENGEFVVTKWYTSEGAPDFAANDGDYCVDTLNGVIYTNIGGDNWDVVISFSSSRIFVGEDITDYDEFYISDVDGAKGGDYYINRVSRDMFYAEASSGKWEWSMSFKPTEEDKAEIVQLVLDALPTWEGGSY